ncbi:hypothetical protein BTUL_0198g00020 [Botrytis tulipae]|uniref:Uncharacterized protein n=1 Tax=Botrytis tulipae TaxID=87230 RepID=A0A4Z1EH24_9HELO|nr:hypothetical protein BTUL_0198g00020 [Botrytis tulipae]
MRPNRIPGPKDERFMVFKRAETGLSSRSPTSFSEQERRIAPQFGLLAPTNLIKKFTNPNNWRVAPQPWRNIEMTGE